MVGRPRRDQARADLGGEIKRAARQQMADHGTAGLSLRAIARALGITAPAIYHYFHRLDDLLTALIVDAYTALAETMEDAVAAAATPRGRFLAAALAYRDWALAHPVEFELIYGNPIPGYVAPAEVTTPLARRPFFVLGEVFVRGWAEGAIRLPFAPADLPASVVRHLESWRDSDGEGVPVAPFYALITGWTQVHGMVMLELFNHLRPVVGDPDAFYRHQVATFLDQLGFTQDDAPH
ncbi:MAG TPA: TetR/AcrR family transcriptional regulator [Ktedonobacterales bacterium]